MNIIKYLLLIPVYFVLIQSVPKDNPKRQIEKLDKGIVAVRTNPEEVFISWRLLGTDPEKVAFNLYRGNQKLNKKPITQTTSFIDRNTGDAVYTVKTVLKGKEQKESASCNIWKQNFTTIPLNRPPGNIMDRRQYTYSPGDASIADLDGDGQYEIVLKWDPSNARDNAQDGYTASVTLDAYELDGKQLWRIDLGRNIRAGAHYTQFMVYDLDGDGKAEVACKTSDGTVDGKGKIIGDSKAEWVNDRGKIVNGPEFLTIFNGETGGG